MDVFHSLEESNLTLITNLKEMEQEIEESKNSFIKKKEIMTKKKNELVANKQELNKLILQTDEDIEELRKTTNKDEISTYYKEL